MAAGRRWNLRSVARTALGIIGLWLAIVLAGIVLAYGRAYWNEGAGREAKYAFDQRSDLSRPGRVVVLATRRAEPEKGFLVGHVWVIWPEEPPIPGMGDRQPAWGHYGDPFWPAVGAVALNLFNPSAFLTGMKPVPGRLLPDYFVEPEMLIEITVDEAAYQQVLAVHQRWLAEQRYSVRPGTYGPRVACQDYVFDIAKAAGLAVPDRFWMEFPYTSWLRLMAANGLSPGPAETGSP